MNENSHPPRDKGARPPDDRLESWKRIATYLNRDVRALRRWEEREGLPAHRQIHDRQATVYAYKSELDAWRESPSPEENGSTRATGHARSLRPRVLLALSAVLVGGLLGGGTLATATGEEREASLDAVVGANTAFATDLHAAVRKNEGNLIHSPFSISTALAMTYAGARGETAKQMASVLHFDALPPDVLHPQMGGLVSAVNDRKITGRYDSDKGKPAYELAVANALWVQAGYPFEEDFLELTEWHYGARLSALEFAKDAETARLTINAWVAERTNDRIEDLIAQGQLSPDARLVLTNAIYFKSAWEQPFNEKATRDEPFHLASGETADVPIMHRTAYLGYHDGGAFEAIELPYAGRRASMFVLVPKEADGLGALEAKLGAADLKAWLAALKVEFVSLGLPRFEFSSSFELSQELQGMGMKDAFKYLAADFSGISPTDELFIAIVIHKALIIVNEEGTEVAASTAVGMAEVGVPPKPRTVQVDRPFLFLIRDTDSGAILFMGRISDPR